MRVNEGANLKLPKKFTRLYKNEPFLTKKTPTWFFQLLNYEIFFSRIFIKCVKCFSNIERIKVFWQFHPLSMTSCY